MINTYAIVERATWNMGKVSETVPLRTTLCIHVVKVIVHNSFYQSLDLMLENLAAKCGSAGDVERETIRLATSSLEYCDTDFTGTISPVLISLAAAATRDGVRRLSRPICPAISMKWDLVRDHFTLSLSPQTQAASAGAPGICGSSFRVGKIVLLGSQGIVVAVLFMVKKSLICVKRWLVVFFGSAMSVEKSN